MVILLLTACSSQKQAVKTSSHADPSMAFVENVILSDVDVNNIVGNASIKLSMGDQSMKVSGALRMRRGEVIRIQLFLPVIGTEVGRLEFTPTQVLLLDRMNKQYTQAEYGKLDFLTKNNITFNTLEALFWDELVSSAHTSATLDEVSEFTVNLDATGSYVPITRQEGDVHIQWNANRSDYTLTSAVLSSGTSMLTWLYSNFTTLGNKKFPRSQEISVSTTLNNSPTRFAITIDLSEIKSTSDWDTHTQVSSKYREVRPETLLLRLMNL